MQRYKATCDHVHGVIASEIKQASLRRVLVAASRKAKHIPTVPLPPDSSGAAVPGQGPAAEEDAASTSTAAPALLPSPEQTSAVAAPTVLQVCALRVHTNVLSH